MKQLLFLLFSILSIVALNAADQVEGGEPDAGTPRVITIDRWRQLSSDRYVNTKLTLNIPHNATYQDIALAACMQLQMNGSLYKHINRVQYEMTDDKSLYKQAGVLIFIPDYNKPYRTLIAR